MVVLGVEQVGCLNLFPACNKYLRCSGYKQNCWEVLKKNYKLVFICHLISKFMFCFRGSLLGEEKRRESCSASYAGLNFWAQVILMPMPSE